MRQEIATKWADALESGEYTQGVEALALVARGGGVAHCCLGVLCELAIGDGVDVPKESLPDDPALLGTPIAYGRGQDFTGLPYEVLAWSGMYSNSGDMPEIGGFKTLAEANDSGVGFAEIAKIIRENAGEL